MNLGRIICSHCGGGHQGDAIVELLRLRKSGGVLSFGVPLLVVRHVVSAMLG